MSSRKTYGVLGEEEEMKHILKLKLKSWMERLLGLPELKSRVDLLYRSLNVGIDANYTRENWAVICLNGNPCYLNLINLGRQDVVDIKEFIKHYESNGTRNFFVDHPHGFHL
jgi:hypothetical protein